jgi:hypothetical protein
MLNGMRWIVIAAALGSACSGGNPAAPSPTPTPTLATVTGHLTATNGGQALPGVSVAFGALSSTTDTTGTFSGSVTPTASMRAVLTGAGILPRTVYLAATGSRDVAVDAFALAGGFDPAFYRELVRNTLDAPTGAEPLRRWTQNPNVYIQTGVADAKTLDMVEAITREMVPAWTDGTLAVAVIERGPDTREGQAGWLTIRWNPANTGHCGTSQVGQSGGFVELQPNTPGCSCNGYQTRPGTVRHELGHAMGFWHTDAPSDLMFGASSACDRALSARERYHAALAYRRPVGNTSPDDDPASAVTLAPMRVY